MRISDWSSDVCSSDLSLAPINHPSPLTGRRRRVGHGDSMLDNRRSVGPGLRKEREGGTSVDPSRHEVLRRQSRPPQRFQRMERLAHGRSEEHTSELQSLMRISYAVFCLKKKKKNIEQKTIHN